ncbi:MAG: reverse transcriptase domain-containing protein [Pseudomonadota bacterium]
MGQKHKRLIERIVDWDNLIEAHRLARRGKRNLEEVLRFEANLWEELGRLQMELLWGAYQPGRYRIFVVREPKRREIAALPYLDRVAQHAICNITAPIWNRAMIDDTFACRPGKGTHAAANRTQRWLRDMHKSGRPVWVLKMDVSKYFQSISHRLAKQVIRRKIACPATLKLLDIIIDSTAGSDEREPVGIPVGNLTSQWIANLVGNELDQWAKRELRLKRYIRYMDDMVVLCWTKEEALAVRAAFANQLAIMGMRFSKTSVLPAARGLNFVGYRLWHDHRLLRRQSVVTMKRRLKALQRKFAAGVIGLDRVRATVASWVAHARHADSHRLRTKVLGAASFTRDKSPAHR